MGIHRWVYRTFLGISINSPSIVKCFVYLEDFESKLNSAFGISRRIIKYHTFGPPPFPEKKTRIHALYIYSFGLSEYS